MPKPRREFLTDLLAVGALQAFAVSPAAARSLTGWLSQSTAQDLNPDFDPKSYSFWSDFLSSDGIPITRPTGQTRGGSVGSDAGAQPVFLHYDSTGFKNAAELDPSTLLHEGDVAVSLNTSAIRVSQQDQATFERLQNAQIRVDVAQRNAMLPVIEAMAYTVVSGMVSLKTEMEPKSSAGPKSKASAKPPAVQTVSVDSDAAWQKMQNIILPGGEGRWALNLEAQKKDSLFYKVLQVVVKQGGIFAPMIGLPGIAMSALQSFNTLYGAIHSEPVQIIKSNPLRVFATQDAIQKTGSPGSVTGILLKSGTYVLVPAEQAPTPAQLQNLTIMQGRLVPPKTAVADLDDAAAQTLKDVTYVTFDVQVQPTNVLSGSSVKKSA
jgi:hypothetical protein